MSISLGSLVQSKRVLVILGSGGVGKTTSSVALAVLAAQQGKKVGLLSIDPAKRLADAMGIRLGSQLSQVPLDSATGSLYGAMLDQKAVFDEMVDRWAPSPETKEKIYQNSIYREVSANLGGPLEYMALAKLQAMAEDPSFDLIVVDTPPDSHALDFLERPDALSGFTEGGVMTWLIKPFHFAQKLGAGRLLKGGGKLMSGISAVTGIKMLQMLAEFLILMEDVIRGFSSAGKKISHILKSEETEFVLVAAPHPAAIRSAKSLLEQLKEKGFPLGAVILNRSFPLDIQDDLARKPELPAYELLAMRLEQAQNLASDLQACALANHDQVPFYKLEEQEVEIHTLSAIQNFAKQLASQIPVESK